MSYVQQLPKFLSFKTICDYSDDQLVYEFKRYKQILAQTRRNGGDFRQLEEDVCYLQAELQNRDLPDNV